MRFRALFFLLIPGWLAAQAPATDPEPYPSYAEGFRMYQEGLFHQAESAFERFLEETREEPLRESAWYFLVKARAAQDSSRTTLYYDQYVVRYPHNLRSAELLTESAHRYLREGQPLMAAEHFERALEIPMPDARADQLAWWRAEAYVASGDPDRARQAYLDLADRYPRSSWAPKALYTRARLYLQEARYAETAEAFELLRARYPFDAMTRRVGTALGETYFQQGRYQEAITALNEALPQLEDRELTLKAIFLIAESHNALGELDQAATWYLRLANDAEGTDLERNARYGLGWVYHRQRIYHWAAREFGQAAVGDDERARKALYYQAVNEKLAGRYDLALRTFGQFGERYKNGFWVETAYYEWAVATFEVGDNPSTVRTLLELIRSGTRLENPGQVYSLLGEAYFANNEFGRAMTAFEAAEKLTDVDPFIAWQARFQRAWVLFQNQAYRDAHSLFLEVYTHDRRGPLAGESLFWAADAMYMMEEYGRAAQLFQTFLETFLGHEYTGAATYSLGWSRFELGEYEPAVTAWRRFLDAYRPPPVALFPYDTDTELRLGDSYYALKNYPEAIRWYERAAGKERGGDYALYQIANSYYRSEQTYEAVQSFRRLLREHPQSRLREQSLYNIGYLYFLAGNYAQAIEEFHTLTRQYRGTTWAARAQYSIGDAHYNAGEYGAAVAAYRVVLDQYPSSPFIIEAVNGIQYAQLAAGQDDGSNRILEEFIKKNPQAGTADRLRFRQAETLLRSGDYRGAIAAFNDYLRTTNNTAAVPDAWYNIADAYRQLGDWESAAGAYEVIVRDHPRSNRAESALLNLGTLYLDQGEARKALGYFDQLAERTRRLRNEAGIGQGDAHYALRDWAAAEAAYRAVLRTAPTHDPARLGLARVLLATNRGADAEPLLREVAQNSQLEAGAEAQYRIGSVLLARRDYPAAQAAFARVTTLYEAYPEWVGHAMVGQALCLRATGDMAEANRLLQAVTDRFPGTPAASEARRLLN